MKVSLFSAVLLLTATLVAAQVVPPLMPGSASLFVPGMMGTAVGESAVPPPRDSSVPVARHVVAQGAQPQARSYIDWETGRIIVETVLLTPGPPDPRRRFRVVEDLDRAAPDLFMANVGALTVDSWYTIGELVAENPALLSSLRELSMRATRETSRYTPDLEAVQAIHSFPLFGPDGLVSHLITHRRAFPMRSVMGPVPAMRSTGLVIYAGEARPVYGRDEDRAPIPSLFPRIYDEEMNLILEKEMCEPARLVEWGMVAYTSSTDLRPHTPRIGSAPLRLMARGVFGRNDTDLIIPSESARRILASPTGRKFLAEGRIVVIYNSTQTEIE